MHLLANMRLYAICIYEKLAIRHTIKTHLTVRLLPAQNRLRLQDRV